MKLLLTSAGLSTLKIRKAFLSIVGLPAKNIKVLFIPTAAITKEEKYYVNESKKELIALGIKKIKTLQINKLYTYSDIKDYDVMYVCGGNTFYLLKKIKEFKFDKLIKRFVKDNKIYLGVSAGSIIACPNIDICSPFDPNDVKLKNLNALNLVDFIVSPHYTPKEKPILAKVMKKYPKLKLIPITDKQAIVVTDKGKKIIK